MTQEVRPPDQDDPQVRPATPEDAAELARLMSLFNNESVSPAQAAARLKGLNGLETALLACQGEEIVGLACVRVSQALFGNAPQAEIIEFYIEGGYRNGDTERSMLRGVENLARQRGANQVMLLAGLKNTDAQLVYRASGYQDYALAMRKRLLRGATII
ncbi:MAG: GNAT family N-acetyltransferase [Chloroflexota bacterium]